MAKKAVNAQPEYRAMTQNTDMIPDDVVAAIAGAIAVVCGDVKIKSIRPASRRAWAAAGAFENTSPF